MTISRRIRWSIVTTAASFAIAAGAEGKCPPTPEKYRSLEFGDVRFAVEEDCRRTFTQREQFFLAGIARALKTHCKLPRDRESRALLERFTQAATLSLDLQKRQGPIDGRIPSQPDRAAAFAAGASMMEDLRCHGPEAALFARGIVIYLKRTSGSSLFVPGCTEFYTGRYTEKHCRCIADAVRPVFPDIDRRFFDKEVVKRSIHHTPRVAVTLMLSCGVSSY